MYKSVTKITLLYNISCIVITSLYFILLNFTFSYRMIQNLFLTEGMLRKAGLHVDKPEAAC